MVDGSEHLHKLLGASMNIADGVDANSIGQSRFAMTGEWKGTISGHQLLLCIDWRLLDFRAFSGRHQFA